MLFQEIFKTKEIKMAARKKDGAPDWKYYESTETVSLFEPVKQYLLKNCKKVIFVRLRPLFINSGRVLTAC